MTVKEVILKHLDEIIIGKDNPDDWNDNLQLIDGKWYFMLDGCDTLSCIIDDIGNVECSKN